LKKGNDKHHDRCGENEQEQFIAEAHPPQCRASLPCRPYSAQLRIIIFIDRKETRAGAKTSMQRPLSFFSGQRMSERTPVTAEMKFNAAFQLRHPPAPFSDGYTATPHWSQRMFVM